MISATVIQDSTSPSNVRLTTLSLTYPRFILSELNTHRALSRNTSSSRAIPIHKMIAEAQGDLRASPVFWGRNQKGMQAREALEGPEALAAQEAWAAAAQSAVRHAEELERIGVHKQITNRVLEPYIHARTIVTATEWGNFYALRRHKDAQPEIKALADAMHEAMANSKPQPLSAGQWHTPYAQTEQSHALECSTARCARISFLLHDGTTPVVSKDIALHDTLRSDAHWSPFEHPATPGHAGQRYDNFIGWKSYRYVIRNERDECICHAR